MSREPDKRKIEKGDCRCTILKDMPEFLFFVSSFFMSGMS